jgi:hypothetical protein
MRLRTGKIINESIFDVDIEKKRNKKIIELLNICHDVKENTNFTNRRDINYFLKCVFELYTFTKTELLQKIYDYDGFIPESRHKHYDTLLGVILDKTFELPNQINKINGKTNKTLVSNLTELLVDIRSLINIIMITKFE